MSEKTPSLDELKQLRDNLLRIIKNCQYPGMIPKYDAELKRINRAIDAKTPKQ